MKRIAFLLLTTICLTACNTNTPETYSGDIVGFIGCYDERDERSIENLHAGVVIRTNKGDSLLSFTMELNSDTHVSYGRYGTYSIKPIAIPYEFYYTIIDSTEENYIKIADIIEDSEHVPCIIPNLQVNILPLN